MRTAATRITLLAALVVAALALVALVDFQPPGPAPTPCGQEQAAAKFLGEELADACP